MNIMPLLVKVRDDLTGLPLPVPWTFAASGILFETIVDALLNGLELLPRSRSEPVPEHDLLERNVRHLWVVDGGEEVFVGLDGGFIARHIKLPRGV